MLFLIRMDADSNQVYHFFKLTLIAFTFPFTPTMTVSQQNHCQSPQFWKRLINNVKESAK